MNQTRLRTFLSLLTAAALLAACMAGCGSATPDSQQNSPAGDTASLSGETASEPVTASEGEPVVISILDFNTEGNMSKGIYTMAELYTKAHPDVTCEIQQMDSAQIFVTYKNRVAAGDPPDLFQGKPRNYTEFIDGGYVADLTDRPFMQHIKQELKAELEYNGKLWGAPIDAQAKGVFYNKNMFAAAGVEVPTTRDEFFQVMDTFVTQGINPISQPLGSNSNSYHIVDCIYTPLFLQRGQPDIWPQSAAGTPVVGNELVRETFALYDEILQYKDPNDPGVSISEGVQDFGVGKRPMMINGGWFVGEVLANAEDAGDTTEFGYFPLPWSNNPEENKMWFGLDEVFLVSAKSPHQEVLYDFVETFIGPEGAKTWTEYSRNMSSRDDVELADALPHVQDMQRYLDSGMVVSKAEVYDYSSESLVAFKNLVQSFGSLSDDARDVDAFLAEIDNEIAAIRS